MEIGRNEPCPCGSGLKFKNCCINKEEIEIEDFELEDELEEYFDEELSQSEMIYNFYSGIHKLLLKDKQHIKKYKKIRKLHSELTDSLLDYYEDKRTKGKIKFVDLLEENKGKLNVSDFDLDTQLGEYAYYDIALYKHSKERKCIIEEVLEKNRYRKPEKVEILNSMLNSVLGLFEVTKTDRKNGQVYLKNVFTKEEYCVTDMGLSSNISNEKIYMYIRLITYDNITFGTGLNIVFWKDNKFICKWIEENKKIYVYNEKSELNRFLELYKQFIDSDKEINTHINTSF